MTIRNAAIVVGLAGVAVAAPLSGTPVRAGAVNLEKVFEAYRRTGSVENRVEKLKKEWEPKATAKRKEISSMKQELGAQGAVLTVEEKKKKEDALEAKMGELRSMLKEEEEKLDILKREVLEEILAEIRALGQEKGYSVILEKTAVLYGPDYADLTDELVKRLAAKAGAGSRSQ